MKVIGETDRPFSANVGSLPLPVPGSQSFTTPPLLPAAQSKPPAPLPDSLSLAPKEV